MNGRSLAFSLIKHISLFLIGVFFFCGLWRVEAPHWQIVLEAAASSLLAMLFAIYFVPFLLYRRTKGRWLKKWLPVVKLLAKLSFAVGRIGQHLPIADARTR